MTTVKDLDEIAKIAENASNAALDRAARVGQRWIETFGKEPIEFVLAQKYACDAVQDIVDVILSFKTESKS